MELICSMKQGRRTVPGSSRWEATSPPPPVSPPQQHLQTPTSALRHLCESRELQNSPKPQAGSRGLGASSTNDHQGASDTQLPLSLSLLLCKMGGGGSNSHSSII